MPRILSQCLGAVLAVTAIIYVLSDAHDWNQAVKVVDSGFRHLATVNESIRPGGLFLENDSYYWLSYARRIGDGETLRVRYTHVDNAPFGRAVHWSQSVSWLLVIFGKARQWLCAETWPVALEQASVWLNPALLVLLATGLGWLIFKRFGSLIAGLFMVYLVSLGDVGWAFQPLRPGHQGLYCLFGVTLVAAIALGGVGWVSTSMPASEKETAAAAPRLRAPELSGAYRYFAFAGVSTALELWVSAVVAETLLVMLFCAVLSAGLFAPKLLHDDNLRVEPELWRRWGCIAGIGSLCFYFLEYFPHHLSLARLEVNGPVYSLSVVAMGEALNQFFRARYTQKDRWPAPLVIGILCTFIAALPPLAIFFGPQTWHALRDPEMLRFHHFIEEFYSMPRFAISGPMALFFHNLGCIPAFLVAAVALAAFGNLRADRWVALWISLLVTLGTLGLGYLQVRWLGLYATMNAWLSVVAGVCLWQLLSEQVSRRVRSWVAAGILVMLLIQPVLFMQRRYKQVNDIIVQRTIPKNLVNLVLNKRLALAFRAVAGTDTRVMAEPDFAPALHYFGEGAAVASFYWENLDGLHAATQFFADPTGTTARQIATDRRLTHVVVEEGNRLQNYFYFYATGTMNLDAAGKTMAARLMGSEFQLPDWLQTNPKLQQLGGELYTYHGMSFEDRWRIYKIDLSPKSGPTQ